jgi:hypothetical protein
LRSSLFFVGTFEIDGASHGTQRDNEVMAIATCVDRLFDFVEVMKITCHFLITDLLSRSSARIVHYHKNLGAKNDRF